MSDGFNSVPESGHGDASMTAQRIFPLPCSVFEEYMVADERLTHPMASHIEVVTSAPLDVPRLESTLQKALARHPLLNSLRTTPLGNRAVWQVQSEPAVLHRLSSPLEPVPKDHRLDLSTHPGLIAGYCEWNGHGYLLLYVHHASADALGMFTFLAEWLALYAGDRPLPPENIVGLPQREVLSGPNAYSLRQRIRNMTRYLVRERPVPLAMQAAPQDPVPQTPVTPQSESHEFASSWAFDQAIPTRYSWNCLSPAEFEQLNQAARTNSVSINDWLAAILFRVIADWNAREAPGPIRLVIPVNRREESERFLSACNKIGYKMLTRWPDSLRNWNALVQGIREEMQPIRDRPQGVYSFLKVLRIFSRLGLLRPLIYRYSTFATSAFSNLGDLSNYFSPLLDVEDGKFRLGEVIVESVRAAPPRRDQMMTTIATFRYGRALHFASGQTGAGLDQQTTTDFLNRYVTAIKASLSNTQEAAPAGESA